MRLWLVERSFDTRNTVTIIYATTDGEYSYRKQATLDLLARSPASAAVERERDRVTAVEDEETRERYAQEATRMADEYDPDDEI
jgi:hypothetical protein